MLSMDETEIKKEPCEMDDLKDIRAAGFYKMLASIDFSCSNLYSILKEVRMETDDKAVVPEGMKQLKSFAKKELLPCVDSMLYAAFIAYNPRSKHKVGDKHSVLEDNHNLRFDIRNSWAARLEEQFSIERLLRYNPFRENGPYHFESYMRNQGASYLLQILRHRDRKELRTSHTRGGRLLKNPDDNKSKGKPPLNHGHQCFGESERYVTEELIEDRLAFRDIRRFLRYQAVCKKEEERVVEHKKSSRML